MSEFISMGDDIGRANGSTLTLVTNSLKKLPNNTQRFNLSDTDDEQALRNYLLRESFPHLIIKIIRINNEQLQSSSRTSIQNAFKSVIRTLMQHTIATFGLFIKGIWLLNGTRAMIDLEDYDKNDEQEPNIVIYEPFDKSQLLIYYPTTDQYIDKILSQIQQQTPSPIPIIAFLMKGDDSSVENIVENIHKHIPTIILKGTGSIANQLAALYEPIEYGFKKLRGGSSSSQILTETDLRQLTYINNTDHPLIFVCQPGKDELDEILLQAVGAAIRMIDSSHVRISEFNFAIQWNKIDYAQRHILNHNTIIDWTDDELDRCLEMAIHSNSVSFVELLFEYGASLQRLALIGNPDLCKLKSERKRRNTQMIELMIESIPVVTHLDSDKRVKAYLRHLFDWTVEHQYFELVMSICTRLEDSIIALLLVSQWCQYKEQNDYIISNNYRKYRRQFEIYAADILDLYYADNKEKTIELLNEKSILYHDQQPLVLMDELCSKTLISTTCMQAYMSSIWYGDQFHIEKNFIWELLICLVCICPLLLFIPVVQNRVFQVDKMDKIEQSNNFWSRIRYRFEPFRRFFQGNAVIRFHYNMGSYTAFLILFSYIILFDYFPLNIYHEKRSNIYRLPIPLTELILHLFLASIALEECRQVILHVKSVFTKSPYWKKLSVIKRHRNTIWSFYKNDPWNILDFVAFTLWIIAFVTRFIVQDHAFELSKICMSLDLWLWYMRCLHVFLASERLGPKLLMIFHTMKDLMSFLFFILIFLLAYAITTYSLISTSSSVIWTNSTYFTTIQTGGNLTNIEILRNIIEWGTWKIFGSTTLTTSDSVEIEYSAKNDAYGFVTLLLTITFLIIAYVLLLNNLIALFNFTIQRVHGESHRAWCYHFYVVLKEYEEKDMFVPPLNLLLLPISYFMRKNFDHRIKNETSLGRVHRDKEQFRRHQQRIAEKYWKEKQRNENRSINQRPYVCRQCQRHGTETDYIESTFL